MIDTNDIEKAKKLIKSADDKPIIVIAKDDDFNRKILEYGKFNVLLNIEKYKSKDSLRQVDSGFNHVLSAIAAKNKISIGIDMNDIYPLNKKEKAERLARIMQNFKIFRKNNNNIKLYNFKDKKNAFSFLLSLGASTEQASKAISF